VNLTRTRVARILIVGATLGMTIGAIMLEAAPASASAAVSEATLTDLSDGDSFHVDIAGTPDEVRLIGIDTPEIGNCEAQAAKDRLGELLANGFTLVGGAAHERDRYGRLLRYAQIAVDPADDIDGYRDGTLDVGAALVAEGYAIARYDSRDGYGTHDRQDAYWDLDALSPPVRLHPRTGRRLHRRTGRGRTGSSRTGSSRISQPPGSPGATRSGATRSGSDRPGRQPPDRRRAGRPGCPDAGCPDADRPGRRRPAPRRQRQPLRRRRSPQPGRLLSPRRLLARYVRPSSD
jgi:endonuclease YncB( thermonuclease family)